MFALVVAAVIAIAAGLYARIFRPWQLTWGATAAEAARALPGDELVRDPTFAATRAITIAASPEEIWPWLIQVGVTRAGWYSYDLLDNLGRHSAVSVIPDLQHLAVGDVLPLSPDGKQGMHVYALDLPRSMTWATLPDSTWTWVLEPDADGTTRLITRVRAHYRWLSPTIIFSMLLEFADIWMMRKMLLNVRDRAQALAATQAGRRALGSPTQVEGARDGRI